MTVLRGGRALRRGSLWGVRLYAVLAACASVLVACEPGCPEGSIAVGDRCVAADGGPPVDAGTDGGSGGVVDGGGAVDGCVAMTFYRDQDGDGHGNVAMTSSACAAPEGYVTSADDCDDTNSARHPGAAELCNEADDDCDGATDEGVVNTYYRDVDGDGFGDPALPTQACARPSGFVENDDDCDDSTMSVHPGATEVCNGVDDDCDGPRDEGFPCVQGETVACTTSCGSRGTGTCTASCAVPAAAACTPPAETCDGDDDDCDGRVDEGLLRITSTSNAHPSTPTIYDAPVGVWTTPGVENNTSFWLQGSSIAAYQLTAGGSLLAGSPSLIALSRPRFHATTAQRPVVAWVDVAGVTAGGSVIVSSRNQTGLAEQWRQTIAPSSGAANNLFVDVRVLGTPTQVLAFPRQANNLVREVILRATTGEVMDDRLLLFVTTGPYGVAGNATRYALVGPLVSSTGGSNSIIVYLGGTAGAVLRTIDLGADIVPREAVVAVDNSRTPADVVVVWSEARTNGTSPRIRYAWFRDEVATPSTTSVIANDRTTPPPALDRHHLSVDYRDGVYFIGAVEATSVSESDGTPRFYELIVRPGSASLTQIGELGAGLHRRISIRRSPIGRGGRIWHSRSVDNGIHWSLIDCPAE